MSKRSINKAEVRDLVLLAEQEVKSRLELFEELKEIYYDEKKLANVIGFTPKSDLKQRYRKLNNILIALLGFSAAIKIIAGFLIFSEENTSILLFLPLFGILEMALIYGLYKYHGETYTFVIMFALLGFVNSFRQMENIQESWEFLLYLFPVIVAGVAYYARKKMFPHLTAKGVFRDEQGNYDLGD